MNIFDYDNYKEFVREKVKTMPHRGRGQYLRIAKHLAIHTTMVTHIFKGKTHLSVEQGLMLANYFGLSDLESDYFVQLILFNRAETVSSREYFNSKLKVLREKQFNLRDRLDQKKSMDEKDQAEFFSVWYYVGIWLASALSGGKSAEELSDFYDLPQSVVNNTLRFLIKIGKVIEQNGRYVATEEPVFIGKESPFLYRHHINWRLKCMEKYDALGRDDLVFTNPITLSKKDFLLIRAELVTVIEKFQKISNPSAPEDVACLLIDWVKWG